MNQEILRQYPRTILELWAGLIWARLDHGKTWFGEEMCHKKCQNFDENLNFWRFFRNDPRSTLNRPKTKKTAFSCKIQWFLDKMVRSTLLHLPHCGAFGWFGRLRAGAWIWPFGTILLIGRAHGSRNRQTSRRNYITALSWLNMSLIEPQEDLKLLWNVSQKCQNFDENFNFWRFFKHDPRSTWNRSKTKKTQFQCKKRWFLNKMVRSTLLHLPLCGAFGWFWRPRAGA